MRVSTIEGRDACTSLHMGLQDQTISDGLVNKFKAHFCIHGDCQKEGIDNFETWSSVACWETVWTMMVLAAILNLKSAQCVGVVRLPTRQSLGNDLAITQTHPFYSR